MENQKKQPRKVVGYFRVGNESQLDTGWQQAHMEQIKNAHPEYDLVGTYCDVGCSSGKIPKVAFMKLIEDVRDGKFDLVITPSMSRLSRNPEVFIDCVQSLKQLGVEIYFENEMCSSKSIELDHMISIHRHMEKMLLDNQQEDTDDIDIEDSEPVSEIQMGG